MACKVVNSCKDMAVPVKGRPYKVSSVLLSSGLRLRVGDEVTVEWGGVCNGIQRTTTGRIIELLSDGKFKIQRGDGKRNANSDVACLVAVGGLYIMQSARRVWGRG